MGGKREVVRDLVDECNAEPNERILLLGAQPREKRDMVVWSKYSKPLKTLNQR
jgi:hypothetical protein